MQQQVQQQVNQQARQQSHPQAQQQAHMQNVDERQKNVLLIAYLFPPIGGGGVQRALKMAKYIGEFGWGVHVLTVEPGYHVSLDETLLEQVPENVHIHRTKEIRLWHRRPSMSVGSSPAQKSDLKPHEAGQSSVGASDSSSEVTVVQARGQASRPSAMSRVKKMVIQVLKKIKNTLIAPDDQILWVPYAKRKGLEIMNEYPIDVIFSTSGPNSAHLVGNYLKRKTGKVWIADFQDPWTQNMHQPDARWRRWLEGHMEARVMREADCILTVTHSFARNFQLKYPDEIRAIEVIHNGFDRADYEHLQRSTPGNSEKWRLVYTGILYEKRNPRLLLKAVAELIEEGIIPREQIVLKFAGVFDYPGNDDNISCVYKLGLQDIVEVLGHLPHHQALQLLADADALMLINDTHPDSGDYIPGKLFEYMAIGHPILAITLPGESTRIIEENQLGEIAHALELNEIKQAVQKLYAQWLDKRSSASRPTVEEDNIGDAETRKDVKDVGSEAKPPRATSLIYERREQARLLVELMNELTTESHISLED